MAEPRLATSWRLELEVLTPLHVGAGGPPLLADYDFVAHRGEVWVLDLERVLERLPDERLAGDVDARLSALLRPEDYPACARYRLRQRGGGGVAEILACARDAFDRPYLPGSSLKGAFRTALAWGKTLKQREEQQRWLDLRRLGERRESAAQPLERALFGPDPNHDLLRALRVSDLRLEGEAEAELSVAAVYSVRGGRLEPKGEAYRWRVETLPAGARLVGSVSLDEHLFSPHARELSFNHERQWLAELPDHCLDFAWELAQQEREFYARAGQRALADFYQKLAKVAEGMGRREGLVQVGWGAGWRGKTLGLAMEAGQRAEVVQRYRLDRGRGGEAFPKTRRLVERGGVPGAPLGWTRFRLAGE